MQAPTLTSAPATRPTWGLREIVVGIVLYILPLFALGFIARFAGVGVLAIPTDVRPLLSAIGLMVFEGLLLAPVGLTAVLWARSDWRTVGFRGFDAGKGCALPVVYLFAAMALSVVWGLVIRVMDWPTQPPIAPLFSDSPIAVALGYVAACVVTPIAEEGFFRGFIIGGLQKRFGMIGALLISAVFFSLLHPPYTIFPVIFALGLLLGLLFIQTDSLWPGIFLHAAFNTIGFLAQFAVTQNIP